MLKFDPSYLEAVKGSDFRPWTNQVLILQKNHVNSSHGHSHGQAT